MTIKYWAKRGTKQVGPCNSRDEALALFRDTFPHKGPAWMERAKKNDILSGYGEFGPAFSIQWTTYGNGETK